MSHCQRARIPNEEERVSCMWIFASKVDSSAHLHADNFAYICIKRTEWCLNPTCSTFSLCFTVLPSTPIDCLHIFYLSRFARHTIGDWHQPGSELPACCKHVFHSVRLCLFSSELKYTVVPWRYGCKLIGKVFGWTC